MLVISQYKIYLTEAGVMHEAGYVTLSGAPSTTSHLNIYIFLFSSAQLMLHFVNV